MREFRPTQFPREIQGLDDELQYHVNRHAGGLESLRRAWHAKRRYGLNRLDHCPSLPANARACFARASARSKWGLSLTASSNASIAFAYWRSAIYRMPTLYWTAAASVETSISCRASMKLPDAA